MNTTFVPGKGSRFNKKQIGAISAELQRINADNGKLTPELVVKEARAPKSVLHSYFEWNKTAAAEKWLLHQAGVLIRAVDVRIELDDRPPVTTRAFISFNDGQGYHSLDVVLQNDGERAKLLAQAKRELHAFMEKYKDLEELNVIFQAVESVAA